MLIELASMNVFIIIIIIITGGRNYRVSSCSREKNTAAWPGLSSGEEPPWPGGAHSWTGRTCTLGGQRMQTEEVEKEEPGLPERGG